MTLKFFTKIQPNYSLTTKKYQKNAHFHTKRNIASHKRIRMVIGLPLCFAKIHLSVAERKT